MADREEILNTVVDHIHHYESRRGTLMDKEEKGGTESQYHMTLSTAKTLDPKYENYKVSDFNKEMSLNPETEKNLVLDKIKEEMAGSGIDFEALELGEAVSYLSMMYNATGYTGNPNTTKAFKRLANSRKNNGPMTEKLRETARATLDVIYSKNVILGGLVNRRLSEQKVFDGNLSVDETYKTPSYNSQELIAQKLEFKNNSDDAKVFLSNYDLWSKNKPGVNLGTFTTMPGEVRPVQQVGPTPKPEIPQGVN